MKTESKITRFAQPSGMMPSQYAQDLVTKTLRCGDVYEKYPLNEIFIKGLHALIRLRMREFWGGKKEAKLT